MSEIKVAVRVGDRVRLKEATVVSTDDTDNDGILAISFDCRPQGQSWVHLDSISEVLPRPLQVGDTVRFKGGSKKVIIQFISAKGQICVEFEDGSISTYHPNLVERIDG